MLKKISCLKTYLFTFVLIFLAVFILSFYSYQKRSFNQPMPLLITNDVPKILKPLYSNSIFIVEQKTGTVLFEKEADLLTPPASLTKLVSLYLAYEKISEGTIKKTDLVPVSLNAWAKMLPTDGSRMFLEPGQRPTLLDIMLGLALPSGNDGAIALAEFIDGNVKTFVKHMNLKMKELGFRYTHFEDPSGLSNSNVTTAREFGEFSRQYVNRFPQSIEDLHSVKNFIYPRKENFAPYHWGRRRSNFLPNHNPTLGYIDGVDGLKTGFISKSGLNISISAKRDNMRIIAVILGSFGKRGNSNRVNDAKNLIDYIYSLYRLETHAFNQLYPPPKAFKEVANARVIPALDSMVTFKDPLTVKPIFNLYNPFSFKKGDVIGYLDITDQSGKKAKVALKIDSDIDKKPTNLFTQMTDFIYRLFTFWV